MDDPYRYDAVVAHMLRTELDYTPPIRWRKRRRILGHLAEIKQREASRRIAEDERLVVVSPSRDRAHRYAIDWVREVRGRRLSNVVVPPFTAFAFSGLSDCKAVVLPGAERSPDYVEIVNALRARRIAIERVES